MTDAILHDLHVGEKVIGLRAGFRELQFCFNDDGFGNYIERLQELI
jgi:hypothetical protein